MLVALGVAGCASSPPGQITAAEAGHLADAWVRAHHRDWARYRPGTPLLESGPHGEPQWGILYTPKSELHAVGDDFTVSVDAITRRISSMGGM